MSRWFAILQNIIFNPKWQNYSIAKGRWYLNKGRTELANATIWCIRNLKINSKNLWTLEVLPFSLLLLITISLNPSIYIFICHSTCHVTPPIHLAAVPTLRIMHCMQTMCQERLGYSDGEKESPHLKGWKQQTEVSLSVFCASLDYQIPGSYRKVEGV